MTKCIAYLCLTLAAVSSVANGLIPAESDFCRIGETALIRCPDDRDYLKGGDGRCGCLTKEDYLNANECAVFRPICREQAPFTSLYQKNRYVGCGCFETIK